MAIVSAKTLKQRYSGSGGLTTISTRTTTYTASSNQIVPCNTSGGPFTVTLPPSPVHGDIVKISDVSGSFATNNLTVNPNGKNINGSAGNLSLDINWSVTELQYFYPTATWVVK